MILNCAELSAFPARVFTVFLAGSNFAKVWFAFPGLPQLSGAFPGLCWPPAAFPGLSQLFRAFFGFPSTGFPKLLLAFLGLPKLFLGFLGFPWPSQAFLGFFPVQAVSQGSFLVGPLRGFQGGGSRGRSGVAGLCA